MFRASKTIRTLSGKNSWGRATPKNPMGSLEYLNLKLNANYNYAVWIIEIKTRRVYN